MFRKSRKQRKYRGGGVEQQSEFLRALGFHDSMKWISAKKPVATPNSGTIDPEGKIENDVQKFIRLWTTLTPEDKNVVNSKRMKHNKPRVNAYITPRSPETANEIIIYAEDYLPILASAAERTPEDILRLIASLGEKTQDDMDIIQVAFNDKEIYGTPLSESGKLLEAKYLSMLP